MNRISIDASPSQIRKLRKGHSVRVKKGTGFELMVHPKTYNIVSRAFSKNKGSQIALSPEELDANEGLKKAISPEAHVGRTEASKVVGQSISGYGIGGTIARNKLHHELNEHLGTYYGYLSRAGIDNAISGKLSAALSKMGIDARHSLSPDAGFSGALAPHSRMVGGAIERSSIGRNGGMLSTYTPPALVSQPFSANFQFQHFLPPQYQHFNMGGASDMVGSGLYLK